MAQLSYRGNLKAASFPFLSELFGRTVVVRGQDQNFVGGLAAKESLDSSVGVPQIYFAQNVIPTDHGYASVGYVQQTAGVGSGFSQVVTIRDGSGNSAQLALTSAGLLYILPAGSNSWQVPVGSPGAAGSRMTVAFVSGVTYIWFSAGVGCYTYDWGTNTMSSVTLDGLVVADILGIVGSTGYLLAYSTDAIAWSSTIDATDFAPSLTTGAGGGAVEGVRGAIVTVEEVYGGLIIFAAANAVAAQYSGNPRYPYNFVPITGCGGLTSPNHVSQDTGAGSIYAYTTSGMQQVSLRAAANVFPELTDFISGSLLEDFDTNTLTLSLIDASGDELEKRIALVADRYLIISYGVGALTHALYYDTAYKQFGRLKLSHVDCFEFIAYTAGTAEVPKRSIAFLQDTGAIQVLESDINSAATHTGVVLLGKFQYVRSRWLQLEAAEFENVNQGDTFALYDLPSLDGKNFQTAVTGYLASSTGKLRTYNFHTVALNHTLLAVGKFNAVSFQLDFVISGSR